MEVTLQRGVGAKAEIRTVTVAGERCVVKDFSGGSLLVRRVLGPWLLRREERAYRALAGCDFVPKLVRGSDGASIVLEYRAGERLTRSLRGRLPATFSADLEAAVTKMHACGVVHLDLRHRSNVLVDGEGRPVILDFASAITGRNGRSGWLGRILRFVDRRAVRKWQRKFDGA
ncbi:MAG: hypothetical protein VCC68_09485 [Myxococcota bacterium]|jgi:RIO-like serine/threonine protein kinase